MRVAQIINFSCPSYLKQVVLADSQRVKAHLPQVGMPKKTPHKWIFKFEVLSADGSKTEKRTCLSWIYSWIISYYIWWALKCISFKLHSAERLSPETAHAFPIIFQKYKLKCWQINVNGGEIMEKWWKKNRITRKKTILDFSSVQFPTVNGWFYSMISVLIATITYQLGWAYYKEQECQNEQKKFIFRMMLAWHGSEFWLFCSRRIISHPNF